MQYQKLDGQTNKPLTNCPSTCPITRYNYFINIYNQPSNQIPNCELERMVQSSVYTFCFTKIKRNLFKVLLIPLLFVIILNLAIPILAWFCLFIYYYRCKVFENNKSKTIDPFVNMVYDPNICQNLNRDHYFFQVQLRQLQGFTFNYNDKLKDQLNLRKERGKVKFMVYSGDFWIHYHGFIRYKTYHWVFAFMTTIIAIGANVMWFFIIF